MTEGNNKKRLSDVPNTLKSAQHQSRHSDEEHELSRLDELIDNSGFIYDTTQSMMDEFYRMCSIFGWRGYSDGKENAKALFNRVLARELMKASDEGTKLRNGPESPDEDLEEISRRLAVLSTSTASVTPDDKQKEAQGTSTTQNSKNPTGGPSSPEPQQQKKLSIRPLPKSPIDLFFDNYPAYNYNLSKPVIDEFNRMNEVYGWNIDSSRGMLTKALADQFNFLYGTDARSAKCWQGLCRVLDIQPIPNRLGDCRRAVKSRHFSIVDLVDCRDRNLDHKVQQFQTKAKLQSYLEEAGKDFSFEDKYTSGLLKDLILDDVRGADYRTGGGPPYDNSINMDRENLGHLWARSYDS